MFTYIMFKYLVPSGTKLFYNDSSTLGYGGLSLSIEGPSKADIDCQDNEDGSCRVTYRPTEPGNYVLNVKFADEHVPGENGSDELSENV